MRPHGRARVDATHPQAFAVCDRCGFLYNHVDLTWQADYRGRELVNTRILVCDRCLDDPQPQLKPVVITADPIPVKYARPESYTIADTDYRITVSGNPRVTMDGRNLVVTGSDTNSEPQFG